MKTLHKSHSVIVQDGLTFGCTKINITLHAHTHRLLKTSCFAPTALCSDDLTLCTCIIIYVCRITSSIFAHLIVLEQHEILKTETGNKCNNLVAMYILQLQRFPWQPGSYNTPRTSMYPNAWWFNNTTPAAAKKNERKQVIKNISKCNRM